MHNRPDLVFTDDEHTNLPTSPEQTQSVLNILSKHLVKSTPKSTPIMYKDSKRHMARNK